MNKKKNINIKFDLLENGMDFIESSLQSILTTDEPHKLKYAILHISAGIELVLKEILRLEHWSFLFENINNANYNDLQTGDFQSVSFSSILKRFEGIIGKDIRADQKKHFDILRKKRNRIEHFAFQESSNALKGTVSKALTDIIDIIDANIDVQGLSEKSQTLYRTIRQDSSKFDEFVALVKAKLKETIDALELNDIKVILCPDCLQKLFPLDGSNTCLFCKYTDSPENIAVRYADVVLNYNSYYAYKYGEECPVRICPECGMESLIIESDFAFCFSCGLDWELEKLSYCEYCNELYVKPSDERSDLGMCSICFQNKIESCC
jgi:hypothetical protein